VSRAAHSARRRAPGGLSYRAAGVDIRAGEEAVRRLAPWARATYRPEVLGDIGAFAGFFRAPRRYRQPVFVASTDGVGSKLRVAFLAGRHDTIGIDLVAMGVNDLLVHGAEPLVFLDYIGTNRVVPRTIETVVRGIAAGCREAGCALIGGEIAELPDFYAPGEYDLAGFALGVVERRRLVEGHGVRPGDAVIGLLSNGLHSNGFSLARKVVFGRLRRRIGDRIPGLNRTVGGELLRPTRIYVKPILALLRAGAPVRAMAHITGGGLTGNLPRVLPPGCRAVIHRGTWPVSEVFRWLQDRGRIDEAEMFRVFNMGIGFVVVAPARHAARALALLWRAGAPAFRIGEIRRGSRGVTYR
jgi:phosphoribosylformylglycinamidine cyclo-ligase